MSNFNQDKRSDNRGRGRRDFGGRDRGPRQMFHAVCDNCGKDCEVPFKPSGDKPIYCSDCFEKQGNTRSFSPNKPDNSNKLLLEQVTLLNTKLDKIISLIEVKPATKPSKKAKA